MSFARIIVRRAENALWARHRKDIVLDIAESEYSAEPVIESVEERIARS